MTTTLKDLGRLAGVHPSTVARVLNGEPRQRVSPEVRMRILELAREHGYQPNYMARADGIAAAMLGSEQIRRSLQMFDFFTRLGSPHERTHTLSWLID